jgi:hypothetical protein
MNGDAARSEEAESAMGLALANSARRGERAALFAQKL